MKKAIHPTTQLVNYVCNSCNTKYSAISTSSNDVTVEVCSNCHPFYTGAEGVVVDTYSRVDKFNKQRQAAEGKASSLVKKRKKLASRRAKVTKTEADKKLTLRDMLKQQK